MDALVSSCATELPTFVARGLLTPYTLLEEIVIP